MLLDRIDIDTHGPLSRVELGPFSEHLNVVHAPRGAGKTALARFVRDSLVSRDYPVGMFSSSAGRVVWADRHGLVHCRREPDGTRGGRQTTLFERRGAQVAPLGPDPLSRVAGHFHGPGVVGDDDASLARRNLQLPECLVDGVVTNTHPTDLRRVIDSAIAAGLDRRDWHRDLPLHDDAYATAHVEATSAAASHAGASLRAELADIDAELASYRNATRRSAVPPRFDFETSKRRLHELHQTAHTLRLRRDHLDRWCGRLRTDLQVGRHVDLSYSDLGQSDAYAAATSLDAPWLPADPNTRPQLRQIDREIDALRRIAAEVRSLTQTLEEYSHWDTPPWANPWDAAAVAAEHYDRFVSAIDHHGRSAWDDAAIARDWQFYDWDLRDHDGRYRSSAWADRHGDWSAHRRDGFTRRSVAELDARIATTLSQIDSWLSAIRHDEPQDWHRAVAPGVSSANTDWDNPLRRVRQHVADVRWDRGVTGPRLEAIDLLARDLDSIGRQIEILEHRRDGLLFDASRLEESLRQQRRDQYTRYRLRDELTRWETARQETDRELVRVLGEASRLRFEMRQLPVYGDIAPGFDGSYGHAGSPPVRDARYHELVARRASVLRQLRRVDPVTISHCPLAESASRWLLRLTGGRLQNLSYRSRGRTVAINGHPENEVAPADRSLAVMAVRMAAAELLSQLGRPIPLVLEVNAAMLSAVRGRSGSAYRDHGRVGRVNDAVATTLRDFVGRGQQLIVLTDDEALPVQLQRVGARRYAIRSHNIASGHRPLWRPHYDTHAYAGPHEFARHPLPGYGVATPYDQTTHGLGSRTPESINQAFDHAWHESSHFDAWGRIPTDGYRSDLGSVSPRSHYARDLGPASPSRDDDGFPAYGSSANHAPRTDWAAPGTRYRDGMHYATRYTTEDFGSQPHPVHGPVSASDGTRRRDDLSDQMLAADLADARHGQTSNAFRNGYAAAASAGAEMMPGESTRSMHGSTTSTSPVTDLGSQRPLRPANPFFLSVDSPIDQAPSVDAVAAARLRAAKVTHINHLMSRDSNRLADSLGLTHVDAATIRRWQAECRLVCQVPRLRGFDARVLVGCGVSTPAQLAAIAPSDLLHDVEAFLATDRGRQILLSGSSHELSRLTTWIAAANAGRDWRSDAFDRDRYEVAGRSADDRRRVRRRRYLVDEDGRRIEIDAEDDREIDSHRSHSTSGELHRIRSRRRSSSRASGSSSGYVVGDRGPRNRSRYSDRDRDAESAERSRIVRSRRWADSDDHDGFEKSARDDHDRDQNSSRRRRRSEYASQDGSDNDAGDGRGYADGRGHGDGRGYGNGRGYGSGSGRGRASGSGSGRGTGRGEGRAHRAERGGREFSRRSERRFRHDDEDRESRSGESRERALRFYLNRNDPVVDAPSIGPRMAARLQKHGIVTVDDLLRADAESLAEALDHRRITAETIQDWQAQATLVCRVPMLRGHDAQLLVAAEVRTAEELAASDVNSLLPAVTTVAQSSEGKRIIRGGQAPDHEEVTEWIGYAQHQRALMAA